MVLLKYGMRKLGLLRIFLKESLSKKVIILNRIARAIREASYVVAVITKDYEDSTSCRNELAFSMNMSKTVIPVLLDRQYYPKSGVGIRIANLQYFLYE
jgi:hypothetical protein